MHAEQVLSQHSLALGCLKIAHLAPRGNIQQDVASLLVSHAQQENFPAGMILFLLERLAMIAALAHTQMFLAPHQTNLVQSVGQVDLQLELE